MLGDVQTVSRPSRLMRKYGPIGATFAAPTPSSISLIDRPCSSCSRQISPIAGVEDAVDDEAGDLGAGDRLLRIAWAKLIAA